MLTTLPFWTAYSALQKTARSMNVLAARAAAIENTLTSLLDDYMVLASVDDSAMAAEITRRLNTFDCRERNRVILRVAFRPEVSPALVGHAGDANVALGEAKAKLTEAEWELLSRLAAGETYKEIATRHAESGHLRVKALRARQKLNYAA